MKYTYTYEYCPHCENEVKLKAEFKVQICPSCGRKILPCSLCDECKADCPLEKKM
jgi:predicted RNA-binding Zn-ribbon protein involved in translation (DUF1610 family)